jgi:DNA polymerase delta subunit 1
MSPIKRSLSLTDHQQEEDLPKRLRGGGGEDGPMEEYYPEPEDLMEDEEMQPPEELEDPVDTANAFGDITEGMRKRWLRPANQVKDNGQDLNLQWLDMDMTGGKPLEKNPNESATRIVGSTTGEVPVIRVFGVTEAGNSVSVFIHGFTPYAYFALPENSTFENTEENLTKIRENINNKLDGASRSKMDEYVRAVSYVSSHKSIMGYDSPHTHFFKVTVAMPTLIPALKRVMETGIDLAGVHNEGGLNEYEPYECNVPFVLRYMIDRDIGGAGWLTLPKKTYQLRPESAKSTHCQVRSIVLMCHDVTCDLFHYYFYYPSHPI